MADLLADKVLLNDFNILDDNYDAISVNLTVWSDVVLEVKKYKTKKFLWMTKTELDTVEKVRVLIDFKGTSHLSDNPTPEFISFVNELKELKNGLLEFKDSSLYETYRVFLRDQRLKNEYRQALKS